MADEMKSNQGATKSTEKKRTDEDIGQSKQEKTSRGFQDIWNQDKKAYEDTSEKIKEMKGKYWPGKK